MGAMRGSRLALPAVLLASMTLAALAAASGQTPPRFGEEISVRLVTVVVRVVDGAGAPLLGLTPDDFRVRVGRRVVPVAAVDWVVSAAESPVAPAAAGTPAAAPENAERSPAGESGKVPADREAIPLTAGEPALLPAEPPPALAAGKLVVIFVQADANSPTRTRGHLRTLPFARELLAALPPEDQVAVLSFDSHLKLWQDFTRDRAVIPEAIYRAIHFGGSPKATSLGATGAPRLAAHFDTAAAADAASPERALAVTAEALAALPGEKVIVFMAWGLGHFSSWGTRMTPAFAPAVRELKAARASVFVLDVTEAGSHSLEVGLEGIAEATGGTYEKTNLFPGLVVEQLARTISGYYVLTLDAGAMPAGGGEVNVSLHSRRATVLMRPTVIPSPGRPTQE